MISDIVPQEEPILVESKNQNGVDFFPCVIASTTVVYK